MTLASMTGFGRARGRLSDRLGAGVVVRSVNHRYLDVQVRTNLREEVPEIEALARAAVGDRFQRGRVSVQLNLEWSTAPAVRVTVNAEAVGDVLDQLGRIERPQATDRSLSAADVLAVPGLISTSAPETILDDEERSALGRVLAAAVDEAVAMRLGEGEQLARQVTSELEEVTSFVDWFEPQMPELRTRIFERTRERINEMLQPGGSVEPERIAQEAALLADRADVAEEVVRLRAHLETFAAKLRGGGVVGRTLDFMCQEIHRELNTLGSKCREIGVADRLVDAKTAAERVREQVQNLE
jgi:uncharacterized protein (TIGR00255 family)